VKMNILYIGMDNTAYSDRSLEVKVADTLAERGHEVTLCCERKPIYREDEECKLKRIITMPLNNPMQIKQKHIDEILKDNYNVIFTSSVSGAPLATKIRKKIKIPLVTQILDIPTWRFESIYPNHQYQFNLWLFWLQHALASDKIVVNHTITERHLKTLTTYPEEDICVIYYGVDHITPNKIPEPKTKTIPIVFVSRLVWYKGFHYLLYALARINKKVSVYVIGNGPEKENWERLAQKIGIDVKFLGGISDYEKFTIIKKSKLMVYPSISLDIGGLAPLEAGICGVPCITFDQPVNKEIYRNSVEYAPYKDARYLSSLIQYYLVAKGDRIKLGKKARDFVLKNRTFKIQAEKLEKIFKKVIE